MTATANDSPSGFTSQLPSNLARTVDHADYKECVFVDTIDDEVRVDAPKAEAGTTHVRARVAEARELREHAHRRVDVVFNVVGGARVIFCDIVPDGLYVSVGTG